MLHSASLRPQPLALISTPMTNAAMRLDARNDFLIMRTFTPPQLENAILCQALPLVRRVSMIGVSAPRIVNQ